MIFLSFSSSSLLSFSIVSFSVTLIARDSMVNV
jgi:hypothetical protein